jgi:hypothetical protein
MTAPYRLEREQWVPAPRDEMFAFFSDAANLEALTPPWLHFRILTPTPINIHEGAIIRYRLTWRGVPLLWKTEITRWEPPHAFEDVQLSGPYRLWHHTHTFESVRGGTRMIDLVRYALPFGVLGRTMHSLSVRRNVREIFDFRRERIRVLFGGDGDDDQIAIR